jgi:hypothetical protein
VISLGECLVAAPRPDRNLRHRSRHAYFSPHRSRVYGQYPASGQNVTLFECQYDANKNFLNISVQGHHGHHTNTAGAAPRTAQRACTDMVGVPVQIEKVSPLRPGFHEIIMKEVNSPRRVACPVSDSGSIEDWVEMN